MWGVTCDRWKFSMSRRARVYDSGGNFTKNSVVSIQTKDHFCDISHPDAALS